MLKIKLNKIFYTSSKMTVHYLKQWKLLIETELRNSILSNHKKHFEHESPLRNDLKITDLVNKRGPVAQ